LHKLKDLKDEEGICASLLECARRWLMDQAKDEGCKRLTRGYLESNQIALEGGHQTPDSMLLKDAFETCFIITKNVAVAIPKGWSGSISEKNLLLGRLSRRHAQDARRTV
jgi:hypothetical protein